MKRSWLCLLLAVLMLLVFASLVAAQTGEDGPTSPPSPESAAPVYQARCANCHGAQGQGDGPQALGAGLAMPDLTDPAIWRDTTPARWFEVISTGVAGKAMPPFGEASSNPLSPSDRWNLVYYLYTLGTSPTQIAMGEALYAQDCAACHGTDGRGGAGVPGFTDLSTMAERSQADLYAAVADTGIEGHQLGLGDVEIQALTDYVRTFSYNYAPPPEGAAPASPAETTATSPFTGDGEGVIAGRVTNGTAGAATPADLVVRLRAFDMNANFVDAITTTVDTDGSFRFTGIDVTVPTQIEPQVTYLGISYFGDLETAISLSPQQPEADVNITVFETTQDAGQVYIERLHLVFDFASDQVQVAELYILSNGGDRAYIGTLEEGTVRLTVPENALNFQPGGEPDRFLPLANGIADTVPIPPGTSTAQSVLVYQMAYQDGLELSRPMPFDARVINMFVPADAGVQISGDGVQAGGLFQTQDMALETYNVDGLAAGEELNLRLSGTVEVSSGSAVTSPQGTSEPSRSQSIAVGLVALAGAVALAYLYWGGNLSFRLRPTGPEREMALFQEIAALDDDHAAGLVEEKTYQQRRARLKQELLALMERETDTT